MLQTLQIIIMLSGAFGLGYLFKFYLNDSLIKHINELKAQVDNLSTKLAWSESEKNKLTASLDAANSEVNNLKNEITEKQNALVMQQAEIEQLQSKAESLELENALAAERIESLREQLQSGDSASAEQSDRIERLHAELNKVKSDNSILLNEKEKLNASLADLNNKFQDSENMLSEYSALSDAMKAEYDNLQDELNKIKEEHSSTAITATTLQTDFENLNKENAALKNSIEDFEAQIESLYGELENNEIAIRALQEGNGELLTEMISLENAEANNYQDAEKALLQLQNEKAALERSVVELIKENEEMIENMSKIYETEVIEKEASVNPVQIEDEVEADIEEKTEISATVISDAEVDNDDVIPDDLKLVEGIGPKIQELLYNSGIKTFQRLSKTPVEHIRRILVLAGDRFAVHDPKSWPEQAKLAAESKWDDLKTFQEHLAAEAEKIEEEKH
jgi:chromosome segregation ATPase